MLTLSGKRETLIPAYPQFASPENIAFEKIDDALSQLSLGPVALGHFHEANVVGQKRIWVNGSIKGPDEYSIKRFGGGRPPCQLLHTFHPERGLVGTDYLML